MIGLSGCGVLREHDQTPAAVNGVGPDTTLACDIDTPDGSRPAKPPDTGDRLAAAEDVAVQQRQGVFPDRPAQPATYLSHRGSVIFWVL